MPGASVVVNQPGVYLVDADGNVVTVTDAATIGNAEAVLIAGKDGSLARFAAVNSSGQIAIQNPSNLDVAISTLATETKLEAVRALLESIKDTDGVKKILDALPAGTNRIGAVRPVDSSDVALDLARDASIPAGSRGLLSLGEDGSGKARSVDVRIDPVDSKRRLQVEGKVSISAPTAPPSTTPVTISADNPLPINSDHTTTYVITSGKTFVIQQISTGAEGDPTEKGTKIEVIYYDGTSEHIIERIYITGFTQFGLFPDTKTARDGTLMTGDGSTKEIRVKRTRLSGSYQEVDAVVRGYEV